MAKFIFVLFGLFVRFIPLRGELWEKDLTSAMKIGPSTKGYKSVDLRCDSGHFAVNVTLGGDFRGVVYTRGSFHDKKPPCFKRRGESNPKGAAELIFGLRIPFHGCRTVMDIAESTYRNTLVVQHDPDLIMPGDAAFSLDCAFVPEFQVASEIKLKEPPFRSKITLVDADPSEEKSNHRDGNLAASSNSEKVTFDPGAREIKDEL